ncbi:hypothetical protein NU219Hw_g2307t1 [Hortaea werneckii]
MNGAPGRGGGMNGKTGPPGVGGPPGMGSKNGINGAPGMGGAPSTRGSLGTGFPQPGPTVSNPSTGYSGPPNWRDYPVDKRTGKVDRRAVGGAAGKNGIEEDGDLLIIESMGTLGRPFNPFQRDLQRFWADPLLRPAVRKRFLEKILTKTHGGTVRCGRLSRRAVVGGCGDGGEVWSIQGRERDMGEPKAHRLWERDNFGGL